MQWPDGEQKTLGYFALVSYIPDPLARFLDDLRLELTPGCNPRAHVTVLPPRPHHSDIQETIKHIIEGSRCFAPFHVELGEVEIFDTSNVIYISIREGLRELHKMYTFLNRGHLEYRENFPYHPHITIAQSLEPAETRRAAEIARKRWAEYKGIRSFEVTRLSFVQHVAPLIWMDVAPVALGEPVAR
jgi:2'-5' RNA ligase